jgi:hypothetical protein
MYIVHSKVNYNIFVCYWVITYKIKVKQSLYRLGQALRVPGVWASQISSESVHETIKVIGHTHQPPLPFRRYPWYSFLAEAEFTPGPWCGRKDNVNEKFQWHHRESNSDTASTNSATAGPPCIKYKIYITPLIKIYLPPVTFFPHYYEGLCTV